ncbi:MAG TPA: type VI secretion system contractile sheath large subunit [Cellvibrionaceae bacterium]
MSYMSVESRVIGKQSKSTHTGEFSVVILGDFSGRASRALNTPLNRFVSVDRDNFFELFSAFGIQLKLPFDTQAIEFNDFDQLHPDYLLDQLAIFARFRQWQRKAQKPEHFASVLEELRAADIWQGESRQETVQNTHTADAGAQVDFLLEQVLNQAVEGSAQTDAEQLIKRIIAPYATAKADMRLPEVQSAINAAMAQTLRSILHHGDFHNLEATWRSLYFLVRRIASDNGIKLWLLDISEAELITATEGEITQSSLYKLIVTQRQAAGQNPHNLLLNLFSAGTTQNSLQWVSALGKIAQAIDGACVAGGVPVLAGCEDLIANPDHKTWLIPENDIQHSWQSFRATPAAAHIALTAPRFLLRSPYGKNSSPIEAFDFTEITAPNNYQQYLWGNSAVLVGVVLAELWLQGKGSLNTSAASQIDQLPIHVEKTSAGELLIPSAEIVILDSTVEALRNAGLLVVRSIYNKNAVLIPLLNSCASNGALLFANE